MPDTPSNEKVLCYIGPSLPISRAVEIAPNVIFRPPARQGDILSDVVEIQPDRVLLIDGEFSQNLSPWHKEIVFCLSKEIKVYGAASMGALRAADLWRQGMIGCGKIFKWYKNGVTEDDSEVALLYSVSPRGEYYPLTVPLADIRATIEFYAEMLQMSVDHQEAVLARAKAIHFSLRTSSRLQKSWEDILGQEIAQMLVNNLISQKAEDAALLLLEYENLRPEPEAVPPTDKALSKFFWGQYDRDRKVSIELGSNRPVVRINQQHIDSYIALHAIDSPQIFWDARNFHLAHMLAEKLGVRVSEQDVMTERSRFYVRHGITSQIEAETWIKANNLTVGEFMILIIRMATVRRMHQWLVSSLVPVETTKITMDYLKMHNSYTYWAHECAETEAKLQERGVDDNLSISATFAIEQQVADHCQRSGITVDGSVEDFVSETGFNSKFELNVAIERLKALET